MKTKLSVILILMNLPFIYADQTADQIETTKESLAEWVENQRIISKEKKDLALSKEILNERIELVKNEIQSLQGKITDAEKSITEADKKRAELVDQNDKLKKASTALGETLASLEDRTKKLLTRLPDPIRERIKPLSQRLPEEPAKTKLSLSERFQNVVGILNEINKANREITVTSEVRTLSNGTSAEVTALYIGISQAYYAGANGNIAGVGHATDDGWQWTENNEAAPEINRAIAILKNEQVADFVKLPIEIK